MRSSDPTAVTAEEPLKETRYFVGGILRTIPREELQDYFARFGDLKDFTLKCDTQGNSRGYGWALYRNPPNLAPGQPHVLRGVAITVEPARSQAPLESKPAEKHAPPRRRRRSRSHSRSRSSSLSSNSSYEMLRRGGGRQARQTPRAERYTSHPRLPAVSLAASRLPPLSTQLQTSAPPPPPPAPASAPAPARAPTTSYEAPASSSGRDANDALSETYLCIPMTLCPSEYLNDPRTFCARLDQGRVGSLNIVSTPLLHANNTPAAVSIPPPPPPLIATQQLGQYGLRSNSNTGTSRAPPPPRLINNGIQRG